MFKSTILAATLIFALTSCDKEEVISTSNLPTEITSYITAHFPGNTIIQVIKDKEGLTKTYDIILSESLSLEFNGKSEIIDINGVTELPSSVIPEKIRQYVQKNYPKNVIIGWEIDNKNQQIELDNKFEIEFSMNGDFIRIDID